MGHALGVFVGHNRIAVGWEAGPGHDLPAMSCRERFGRRGAGGMHTRESEAGFAPDVRRPEADTVHHDAVIGRQGAVGAQFPDQNSAVRMLEAALLASEFREMGEGDGLRGFGRN